MPFLFRFETLLGLRQSLEELAQQNLARELAVLAGQQRRLEELRLLRRSLIAEFEEKKHRLLAAPLFSFYMEAISVREQEIAAGRLLVQDQQQMVQQKRLELTERVRERKVLEKTREKDRQRFIREQLHKEQMEADEQMVLRFGRQGNLQ
jgi:flagellar FliJ protein